MSSKGKTSLAKALCWSYKLDRLVDCNFKYSINSIRLANLLQGIQQAKPKKDITNNIHNHLFQYQSCHNIGAMPCRGQMWLNRENGRVPVKTRIVVSLAVQCADDVSCCPQTCHLRLSIRSCSERSTVQCTGPLQGSPSSWSQSKPVALKKF